MIRAIPLAGLLMVAQIGTGAATPPARPPAPAWATDADACIWRWTEGGGIGFWSESCALGPGIWNIVWDAGSGAFWQTLDGAQHMRVVQVWPIDRDRDLGQLIHMFRDTGDLAWDSDCGFQPSAPVQGSATRHMLSPATGWPPVTVTTEVPDDPCGPYGVSAGAVRQVLTDPRWPDRAVFVDLGQERPMFDPDSIRTVP